MVVVSLFAAGMLGYVLGGLTVSVLNALDNDRYYKETKKNIQDLLKEIDRLQNKLIEQNARTFYLKLQ
jgi:hypothetical protein